MPRAVRLALLRRLRSSLPVRRLALPLPPPAVEPPRRKRPWGRVLLVLVGIAVVLGTAIALFAWVLLTSSLPPLEGRFHVEGLSAAVRIERDALGVPTLHAANRTDLALATGFVHGQDRFFHLDLLRRHPAGELAELFGPAALEADRRMRLHRFRARVQARMKAASSEERALFEAYTRGVEAGRKTLRRPPWEYLALGVAPRPWTEEDVLLVVLGMYQQLQGSGITHEHAQGLLEDLLPPPLARFLTPPGSPWDAPLLGGALPATPIPTAEQIDLRKRPTDWLPPPAPVTRAAVRPGSNNWAVSGKHTAHGGAILANDMHLGLMIPHVWYRAMFVWSQDGKRHRVAGVTLPGTPALVAGSNTHIAWGFTNTEGDFTDLVLLEPDDRSAGTYRTPTGPRPPVVHEETIRVNGGPDLVLRVEETLWGPIWDRDHRGRSRALRWVAHEPGALNLDILRLETARSIEEALTIAPRVGSPGQNLVVVDARGRIAWTVLGRLPRRVGFAGRRTTSWADGSRRWDGWLPIQDYPRIVHPPEGMLWTANNRVVDEPGAGRIGQGNYDHGARAMQIRDQLRGRSNFREDDMLRIQLDDRASFLARWQRLLVELLTPGNRAGDPRREAVWREVRSWGERATIDSVGFRIVRRFRALVRDDVLRSLTAPCSRADPRFNPNHLDSNTEESLWQLVTRRPPHLLPPAHPSWEALLLSAVDAIVTEVEGKPATAFEPALAAYTWGEGNRARIRHPLSSALGPAGRFLRLDMPEDALPGDSRGMPRVQAPSEGASQRMAVSPGREHEGYFHMPGGQSGHPLSPHYRDHHPAWARGKATPFLPGPAVHVVELRP